MNLLLSYNWIGFLSICVIIVLIRISVKSFFPIRILSIIDSATVGFILFFASTILGYSSHIVIENWEYVLLICIAYFFFILGAIFARRIMGKRSDFDKQLSPGNFLTAFAMIFCIIWISYLLFHFIRLGSFSQAYRTFFGGTAHFQYVTDIGINADSIKSQDFGTLINKFFTNIFYCCWFIIFIKRPKLAISMWLFYVVFGLATYTSRTTLLSQVAIPFFAYIVVFHPRPRFLFFQVMIASIVVVILFSWYSAVRIGRGFKASPETVVKTTMFDIGSSGIYATNILASSSILRGDPINYLTNMVVFIIPRSLWEDKPYENYNYWMTIQLTGHSIGVGNSVLTTTMLGEAWYYFGVSGTIWLMLIFGFYSYFLEWFLTRHYYTFGVFIQMTILAFIQIRSTFLTFFQVGIIAIISVSIFVLLVNVFIKKKVR